jgi:hypothetical protein
MAHLGDPVRRRGAMSRWLPLSTEQKGIVGAFAVRPYRTTNQQRDDAALVRHLPAAH